MKKLFAIIAILGSISLSSFAQSHSDRITFGMGLLYERGLDATLAWEHETKYHNAWEYFVNGYLKWDECESCGHVCPESFWKTFSALPDSSMPSYTAVHCPGPQLPFRSSHGLFSDIPLPAANSRPRPGWYPADCR